VDTGLALVEGAFYTITIQLQDRAGNPQTTVSNAYIYSYSAYGVGPVGNVNNTGASANKVDNADVATMKAAMGSRPGTAKWNPVCDLNKDGVIDSKDLAILMKNFGK
jgi:hypothetical protein